MLSRGFYAFSLMTGIVTLFCGAVYFQYYNNMMLKEKNQIASNFHYSEKTVLNKRKHRRTNYGGKQRPGFPVTNSPTGKLKQKNSQGFVLPYKLYEQQTSAARNLFELQYWANTVNMKVVEPFVSDKSFSLFPIVERVSNPVRFSDLYDSIYWNEQAIKYNCAELVSWENFLLNAPKTTILVLPWGNKLSSTRKSGYATIVTNPDEIEGDRECQGAKFPIVALEYFRDLGFHFVREVCIAFNFTTPMSIQLFSQHILGNHDPNSVTLIFGHWQGIAKSRVNIKGTASLHNSDTISMNLFPSMKMLNDSETYMKKVNPNGGKYFGVMVRVQKRFQYLTRKSGYADEDALKVFKECATNLTQLFSSHPKWSRTLAIDLGKYGSNAYRYSPNKKRPEEILYETFFTPVYSNGNWTINGFEESFKMICDIDNPVVIAQLQRTIAAKSDCLILVGSGSFQAVAQAMYKKLHPNEQDQCIVRYCHR